MAGAVLSRSLTMGNGAAPDDAAGARWRRAPARRAARAAADPGAAAIVVLAVAEAAVDADRPAVRVHDDDRVHAVGLARAAEVLDRLAGAIRPRWLTSRCYDRTMKPSDSILFSGGAPGAEAEFGACAERHGVEEVNFTFDGHKIDAAPRRPRAQSRRAAGRRRQPRVRRPASCIAGTPTARPSARCCRRSGIRSTTARRSTSSARSWTMGPCAAAPAGAPSSRSCATSRCTSSIRTRTSWFRWTGSDWDGARASRRRRSSRTRTSPAPAPEPSRTTAGEAIEELFTRIVRSLTVLTADVVIVGAGAAGLATAIFIRRANPARSVLLLDGARKPGAKILVSGGARCNVTNRVVSERDFWGGRRTLDPTRAARVHGRRHRPLLSDAGRPAARRGRRQAVSRHNRSRDVLTALLRGVDAAGVQLLADHRVARGSNAGRAPRGFSVVTSHGADRLPAGRARHRRRVAAENRQRRRGLPVSPNGSGTPSCRRRRRSCRCVLDERRRRLDPPRAVRRLARRSSCTSGSTAGSPNGSTGSLLWTHFGISGPVALNMSRHWLRAQRDGRTPSLTASLSPSRLVRQPRRQWTAAAATRPKSSLLAALSAPASPDRSPPRCSRGCRSTRPVSSPTLTRDERRPPRARPRGVAAAGDRLARLQLRRGHGRRRGARRDQPWRRWSRASARGCIWSARCSTSTAASAGSIFSGRGRPRTSPGGR